MAHATSLEFPFFYAEVENLGRLFYPIVQIQLKTYLGWQKFDFLVDTGADLTTIPYSFVKQLGINTSKLSKSKTQGVGGITVETWNLKLPIMIGKEIFTIHASVVKGNTIPPLLSKKDIFDKRYSLTIDSKRNLTIISKNV